MSNHQNVPMTLENVLSSQVNCFEPPCNMEALGRQRQVDLCELEAILVYIVSSRTTRAIQRNPVSNNKRGGGGEGSGKGRKRECGREGKRDHFSLSNITWVCIHCFLGENPATSERLKWKRALYYILHLKITDSI